MSTTRKRVAFKDVVAEPLNWNAPTPATHEPQDSSDAPQSRAEQGSDN